MKVEPFMKACPGDVILATRTLLRWLPNSSTSDCVKQGEVGFIIGRRDVTNAIELDLLHHGRIITIMCWSDAEARHWKIVTDRRP